MIILLLIALQIIGVSRGDIYVFNSQKDYLRKRDSTQIFLSKSFYNAYDAKFDYLWLYVLTQEGLWSINPLNGEIISFYPLKGNFYKFAKDKEGNFYFLEKGTQRLKVINFSRKDSFHLLVLPATEVKNMEVLDNKLYFLSLKGLFEVDLYSFDMKVLRKGSFDRFKIYDSLLILSHRNCIFLKNRKQNEICLDCEVSDFIFFKDTLFILSSDSILGFPFREIYR